MFKRLMGKCSRTDKAEAAGEDGQERSWLVDREISGGDESLNTRGKEGKEERIRVAALSLESLAG